MGSHKSKTPWPRVKFGDVVKNVAETCRDAQAEGLERYLGLDHFDGGELKIRRWGNLCEDEVSFTRRFRKGQVLFAKRRAYQRKVAVAEFDGICSSDILCLEPKDPKTLLPELLPFICQTNAFFNHALGTSAGSLSPRTRWSQLKTFEFPLPSLVEQKRLAKILWAVEVAMEKYKATQFQLFRLQRTRLHSHIPLHHRNNQWPLVHLVDFFEIASGQVKPTELPYKSMPLIAPNHIEAGTGRILNVETAEQQNAISGKYFFNAGDVVYSKIRPNLQKVFLASSAGLCSADMYPLRCRENLLPEFLLEILLSPHFTHFATAASVRTGIPKINRRELSQYKFPLPPLKEQKRIMSVLNLIKSEADRLIKHHNRLHILKTSLLASLFKRGTS